MKQIKLICQKAANSLFLKLIYSEILNKYVIAG